MAATNYSDKLAEKIAEMHSDVKYMIQEIAEIKSKYVTRNMFEPIQKIVYGLVGLILTSVVVALIALVVQQ